MSAQAASIHIGPDAAAAVAGWLANRVSEVDPPLRFELIVGGRSNLTYAVNDRAGRRWVLRRPPLAGVVQSAHDVGREHRIMAALAGTAVPVPRMIGSNDDADLIGAPFYVMDFVDGVVPADRETVERHLEVPARAALAESVVDVLVGLHAVSPAAVGLADLGRGPGYVERQLVRWSAQLERLGDPPSPLMRDVQGRLLASVPSQVDTTIVHGDYRLGNMIVGPDGAVRALLDWELCTLGDPLADLGWLLSSWSPESGGPDPGLSVPTIAEGFPPAEEVLRRYRGRSGRGVHDAGFYIAFGFWRLAAILAGVRARILRGAYGPVGPEADELAARLERCTEAADAAARAAGL
jgi:aminoglycoside phosphotransferase (APT) family kinase protein